MKKNDIAKKRRRKGTQLIDLDDPTTISNGNLVSYADFYFLYDTYQRVKSEFLYRNTQNYREVKGVRIAPLSL